MKYRMHLICCLFLTVSLTVGCKDQGTDQTESAARTAATMFTKTAEICSIDAGGGVKAAGGTGTGATEAAVDRLQIAKNGRGAAYILGDGEGYRVGHNGKVGKTYTIIGEVILSPDGGRVAYGAQKPNTWCLVVDGREVTDVAELGTPVFSPDGAHLAFTARIGDQWHLFVDAVSRVKSPEQISRYAFNADGTRIAYVEGGNDPGKQRLTVSDLAFKKQTHRELCGELMTVNDAHTRLAAVCTGSGKRRVAEMSFAQPDAVKEGPLYDAISNVSLSKDGTSVAYLAQKGAERLIILNGKEERFRGGAMVGPFVFRPDGKGVTFLTERGDRLVLYQAFHQADIEEKGYPEVGDIAYSADSRHYAYCAKVASKGQRDKSILVVLDGKEGPRFDMVVSPVFSPDGRFLVYRVRDNGKRFVVVADGSTGKVIQRHPSHEQVFQPVFTPDGKSVAYGVKDGNKLVWEVVKL